MQSLQEIAATRAALLLAENGLPMAAGVRVPYTLSNAILVALHRLDLLDRETLDRLFSGNFMISTGVDLADGQCDEQTLWKIAQHGILSRSLYRTTTSTGSETRLLLPRVVVCLRANSRFLRDLRHLDIGGCLQYEPCGWLRCEPFNLLPMLNRFISLESLMMSEAACLTNDDLSAIASHHYNLRFLDISNCPNISDISGLRPLRSAVSPFFLDRLDRAGRHGKIEQAFTRGFVSSLSDEDYRECASLVETAMRFHSSTEAVQQLGALCQYFIVEHLQSRDHWDEFPTALLTDMLERCLHAAEAFPQNEMISDYTLHLADRVHFTVYAMDYVRIMRIGLNLMVKRGGFIDNGIYYINEYLDRMDRSEQDVIAADGRIIPVFLNWIRSTTGLDSQQIHRAMEFLYRLAKGRPALYRQLVENNGVELAFRFALDSEDFQNDRSGVLSLLASLAKEESSVQFHLSRHEYIAPLFRLLVVCPPEEYHGLFDAREELRIQDQYMAGYILAHLLTSPYWDDCGIEKEWANLQLVSAVEFWLEHNCVVQPLPPFFPDLALLGLEVCAGAQLLALWSIHGPVRGGYNERTRFGEEGGCERLEVLLGHNSTLPDSGKQLATEILEAMSSPPVEP